MIALIFDDSSSLQGNVDVASKEEFDEFIDQLPDDWYGELRLGGSKYNQDPTPPPVTVDECNICYAKVIESRMRTHIHRNHRGVR